MRKEGNGDGRASFRPRVVVGLVREEAVEEGVKS
jgi:hypothetical protein